MPKQLNEFAQELGAEPSEQHTPEHDHEGAMAKADLFKLANYSLKLFKQMHDGDQLESWVQAKITKAADYIASVYHYMEYEMKFSEYGAKLENSGMYSESEKLELKNKLNEAREMLKTLKLQQAEKLDEGKKKGDGNLANNAKPYDKVTQGDVIAGRLGKDEKGGKKEKVEEGMGGEMVPCEHCGGAGHVQTPAKTWSPEAKAKAAAYNKKAKAYAAATKRIDANKNGIPDDEEAGEQKAPAAKKSDKKEAPAKKPEADSGDEPAGTKSANNYGQGIYEGEKTMSRAGKGVMKYGKDGMKALAKAGKEGKDLEAVRNKYDKYDESAPSAGMTKKQKSAVVKDAKAGKDIGKPGKSFDKVAKAAGGGEKGKKIAAAAMWKNKAKAVSEGVVGDIATSVSNTMGDIFNTDASLERRSPQLQQLIAMRKKYPDGSPEAKQLDARIKAQKDRLTIDGSEVSGQGGMPKPVVDPATFTKQNPNFKYEESINESAELNRMKEFLTRLNG